MSSGFTNWDSKRQFYIDSVKKAITNDLNNFKRDKQYKKILEHCGEYEASKYISFLKDKNIPDNLLDKFKENDKIGNPELVYTNDFGIISRATLKYMKIAYDIKELIGSDSKINVLEIGGGYGGQLNILSKLININKVYIADIPIVEDLQTKYLNKCGIEVEKINSNGIEKYKYYKFDLVISNHAICELEKFVQDTYIPLFKNSKHGYIVYDKNEENNEIKNYGGYVLNDFIKLINHKVEITNTIFNNLPIIKW